MSGPRVPYDQDDDALLIKYIATYNPDKPGRMGNALYRRLVENEEGKWPWSKRHSWQSWRERYKDNQHRFDATIRKYQRKKSMLSANGVSEKGGSSKENAQQEDHISRTGATNAGTDAPMSSPNVARSQVSINHPNTNLNAFKSKEEITPKHQITPPRPRPLEPLAVKLRARKIPLFIAPSGLEDDEEASPKTVFSASRSVLEGEEQKGRSKRPRRQLASRTARKTVVSVSQLESEDDGDDDDLSPRQPASYAHARKTATAPLIHSESEDEEEMEGNKVNQKVRTSSDQDSTRDRKRKGNAVNSPSETKRRRFGADDSSVNGKLDGEGSLRRSGTIGAVQNGTNAGPNASQQGPGIQIPYPYPTPSRNLELLSAIPGNGNVFDNKKLVDLLLQTLESRPEEKKQIMDYVQSRVFQADHASGANENGQGHERLYPRLADDDYNPVDSTFQDSIPGSWKNGRAPTTSTSPIRSARVDESPRPEPTVAEGAGRAKMSAEREMIPAAHVPSPQPRQRVSNKKPADDYFKTPSPSPQKPSVVQHRPASATSTGMQVDHEEAMKKDTVSPNVSTERGHPRVTSHLLTSSYIRSRQVRSPATGGDSDTDIITDEDDPVHSAKKQFWPPLGTKRSAKNSVVPNGGGSAERRSTAIMRSDPTQSAALAKPKNSSLNLAVQASPTTKHTKNTASVSFDETRIAAPKPPSTRSERFVHVEDRSVHRDWIEPSKASQPGTSRLSDTVVPATSAEKAAKAKSIRAWRSETEFSDEQDAGGVLTPVTDPFLTIDDASRLRRQEKGKGKESEVVEVRKRATSEVNARANRRKTFGGFSTMKPPEIDLRKRALRSSIASNPLINSRQTSFSSSRSPAEDTEQVDDLRPILKTHRRTSVAANIDLTQEFPSPGMEIPSNDHAFIMRAGLQVLIQSIAQNHAVSEEFVRGIYEELRDLQATDRVVSKMRHVAERAVEEELEREKRKKLAGESVTVPIFQGSKANHSPAIVSSVRSSPNKHEADTSIISAPGNRSNIKRRHSELYITPADEDPTLVRWRNQYVPPSTSRAARYVRARARRSSGVTGSPLDHYIERRHDDDGDNSEKEEEEVTMALTPAPTFEAFMDPSDRGYTEQDTPSKSAISLKALLNNDKKANESFPQQKPPSKGDWTAEEDAILLVGEDEEAIKAIVEIRGRLAVTRRIVDLNADGVS